MTLQALACDLLRFNQDDARKLLSQLDHIHLVAIMPDAPKGTFPHGKYFGSDAEAALSWAANANGNGWGVYWTLNYVGPSVGTKPKKTDIQAARGAHCDLDPPKDGTPWDKAEVAHALASWTVPPSLIIDSGNGVQPVWLLDSPAKEWEAIERVNIGIRDMFGGDDCHNIDRLLRVPGSINYPNKAKRERGAVPCMATWLQDDTGQRFHVDELSQAFPVAKRERERTEQAGERAPTQTDDLIAAIQRGDNWHNNMLRLTAQLVAKGMPTAAILTMADALTLHGYTVDETREDMRGMVADARRKWDYVEPEDRQLGYVDDHGEWTAYGEDWHASGQEPPAPELLPTLDLAALAETRAVPKAFAIERIAPLGEVTTLNGPGSAGKSLLGQQIATSAAAGLPCLGLEVKQTPALYLTCEDDEDQLHFRQERLCEALRVSMASLAGKLHLSSLRGMLGNELASFGHDGKMTPTTTFGRLVDTIKSNGVKLAILDNVAHLFAGNENDRADVTRFVNLLNKLAGETGAAIILLGHPNKRDDEYSGSTAWSNAVRSRLYLEHDETTDKRKLTLPKANYSQKGDVVSFRWVDWAFMRDDDIPEDRREAMDEVIRANAENAAFLACLDMRNEQERPVSESPASRTFAPKEFATMSEAKGFKKHQLEAAMDRLFRTGEIEIGLVCRTGRKDRFGLRRRCADLCADPALTPRADPAPTPRRPAPTHTPYTTYNPGAAPEPAAPEGEHE